MVEASIGTRTILQAEWYILLRENGFYVRQDVNGSSVVEHGPLPDRETANAIVADLRQSFDREFERFKQGLLQGVTVDPA